MSFIKNSTKFGFALLLTIGSMLQGKAFALSGEWQENSHAAVRLLIDPTAEEGDSARVSGALQFRMQDGWKNYWRSPGAAGLPPRITLEGAENIAAVEVRFPAPVRFVEPWGLETFGYKEAVTYPLEIRVQNPFQPASLRGKLDYMVCNETCVPFTVPLEAHFTVGQGVDDTVKAQIAEAKARVPGSLTAEGVELLRQGVTQEGGKPVYKARFRQAEAFAAELDLFIEGPNGIGFPKPEIQRNADGRDVTFTTAYEISFQDQKLAGAPVVLTLVADHRRGVESETITVGEWQDNTAASAATSGTQPTDGEVAEDVSLPLMLAFAFIGGLILNIMPCVLPVLSLKLIGVMKQAGARRGQIRASFLASAAGIVFSFLLLALVAALLQQAGMAVGWGMHFQEPVFVLGMTLVMVLFAANLWGWFEVQVGGRVTETVLTTIDDAEASHHHWGHFVSGVFATLLATPCSAPFLGTAIGFALSGTVMQLFLIFFVMGLGLAAPYLLVALFPALAQHLPKPGAWMLQVKIIFGGLLLLTACWLLWVLYGQLGLWPAVLAATLMSDVLAVLYLKHRGALRQLHHARIWLLIGGLGVIAIVVPLQLAHWLPPVNLKVEQHADYWQPFDEAAIPRLVAEGKVVFVDVTADWCVTCKANKFLVLDRDDMQERMSAPDIVAMQADWTHHDASIGEYLRRYDRYGIPFNIVYGPGAPEGIALPEFLTREEVEQAIEQAN